MRNVLKLSMLFAGLSALALAETFSGTLMDASCAAQKKNAACTPTEATSSFAIQSSGKLLKLDAAGNTKAAEALKQYNSSADRAKNPNAPDSQVTATVNGTMSGDEIKVDSVEVH